MSTEPARKAWAADLARERRALDIERAELNRLALVAAPAFSESLSQKIGITVDQSASMAKGIELAELALTFQKAEAAGGRVVNIFEAIERVAAQGKQSAGRAPENKAAGRKKD